MIRYSFSSIKFFLQLNGNDRLSMIGYLEIDEKIQEFLHSSRKYFTIFITSCHLIRFIGNISTYVKQTKDSVQNTRVEMFSTGISVAPL